MREAGDFKELLNREGLKNTKHRNSILAVIEKNEQPVTAEDIFLTLKDQGIAISLSTVYRVLDTLTDKSFVVKASITDDNKALFEINRMEHKHYVHCIKCHKMLPVDGCPLDAYEKVIEEKLGFDILGHRLEMYGYCPNCRPV